MNESDDSLKTIVNRQFVSRLSEASSYIRGCPRYLTVTRNLWSGHGDKRMSTWRPLPAVKFHVINKIGSWHKVCTGIRQIRRERKEEPCARDYFVERTSRWISARLGGWYRGVHFLSCSLSAVRVWILYDERVIATHYYSELSVVYYIVLSHTIDMDSNVVKDIEYMCCVK